MDSFTQRMLERAEQRSKQLGLPASASKFPLAESNADPSGNSTSTSTETRSRKPSRDSPSRKAAAPQPPKTTPQKKSTTTTTTTVSRSASSARRRSIDEDESRRIGNTAVSISEASKENCDVALEINITTASNVQVQVEVEEREIDADGNVLNTTTRSVQRKASADSIGQRTTPQKLQRSIAAVPPSTSSSTETNAKTASASTAIRDTSRNRLQRLGALYSENENLSSPIHRNEARIDAESLQTDGGSSGACSGRSAARSGKLAALADSMKTWEDESTPAASSTVAADRHRNKQHVAIATTTNSPGKSVSTHKQSRTPSKTTTASGSSATASSSDGGKRAATSGATPQKSIVRQTDRLAAGGNAPVDRSPAKQLKWDSNVMDSLQAQGFQRRESTTTKMVYDYGTEDAAANPSTPEKRKAAEKPHVVEMAKKATAASHVEQPLQTKPAAEDAAPKSLASVVVVSKGLVSGRAALFETGRGAGDRAPAPKANQKDPAEMSLRDRLALFEKNKGTALVPKAAFGMSASQRQIDANKESAAQPTVTTTRAPHKDAGGSVGRTANAVTKAAVSSASAAAAERPKIDGYNKPVLAESNAAGNCIRSTVAALMNKGATISQAEIAADVRQQREREMHVLLNRFQRPNVETETPVQAQCVAAPAAPPKSGTTAQPPPPPPPPPTQHGGTNATTTTVVKRKSGGGSAERRHDRDQTRSPTKEEAKRSKRVTTNTAMNRLYPVLSDIESTTATESSEVDESTTAALQSEFDEDDADAGAGYENVDYNEEADFSYMAADEHDDMANLSLGREIMQAVHQRREPCILDTSTATSSDLSSAANVTGDMDDYLDEALDEDEDDDADQEEVTPRRRGTISSNSFSYACSPPKPARQPATIPELHINSDTSDADDDDDASGAKMSQTEHKPIRGDAAATDYRNPIKSELRVDPSSDNNIVTLTHTVSFYRRQQASVPNTPVRKVTYSDQEPTGGSSSAVRRVVVPEENIAMASSSQRSKSNRTGDDVDDAADAVGGDSDADEMTEAQRIELVQQQVAEKVRRLLDEIRKQEQIMSQTSQALNLCAATIEFSGSTESVEGERHLLVASHRRQAALNEVQRLRVERCLRDDRMPMDQGRLTVREITVPLRQEYKDKLNTETICGHQLVCLLKYNETVVATKTVPTLPGLLAVKFPDALQIDGVYADFKITLEIYGMTAQRENVPHELKYHINRKTPKSGSKASQSRLVMPPVQSPGGPGAVRTPALTQYGMVIFSLREIKRTNWQLAQMSAMSPLAGNVFMKANMEIKMHIDMRGFLTMFEDVSGFGAWHRRWCRLHDTELSYWRYPDDEKTKAPIGTIDLKQCWTQKVAAVARDVCARQHTMELEIRRATEESDRNSLVLDRKSGGFTVLRHLLSADTKEERIRWSAYFNKALILVRSWGLGSASGNFM